MIRKYSLELRMVHLDTALGTPAPSLRQVDRLLSSTLLQSMRYQPLSAQNPGIANFWSRPRTAEATVP